MEFDNFVTHSIDMYMGKPKSGKTIIAGSYPKPLLYISVGNDGGGRVLRSMYPQDIAKGLIKVKNLRNDMPVNGKIQSTSIEKLASVLAELRRTTNPNEKFKTIVIDTIGALQDDYKAYIEFNKKGMMLSQQEWGDIQKMMVNIRDNMKRFSEETGTIIVWCTHTREQELCETSGLAKELRIVPDLTISTGVKFMKDASNIFYCCRKTIINDDNTRTVRFLTYVGPHPLMDTGTRDIILQQGDFVENFNYDKFQKMIEVGSLVGANVAVPENGENEEQNKDSQED